MMSYSRWSAGKRHQNAPSGVFCDADELTVYFFGHERLSDFAFFLPFLEFRLKYGNSDMGRKGYGMEQWRPRAYLLGLLAMIKCSICSYQCDN